MNLIVDFGNTRVKAALFLNGQLVQQRVYTTGEALLTDTTFIHQATDCLLASVVTHHGPTENALRLLFPVTVFTSQTPLPIKNAYKTTQTLGSDRLAASMGGFFLYPHQNVLVIDAGTCIKYNFMDFSNTYLGGAITPGLQMQLKALQHYTDRLPLVALEETFNTLIGENTQDSILSGVINSSVFAIEGHIAAYQEKYPDLTILITGGDAPFLAKRLKNRIFAEPNLVLIGLNTILTHYRESYSK